MSPHTQKLGPRPSLGGAIKIQKGPEHLLVDICDSDQSSDHAANYACVGVCITTKLYRLLYGLFIEWFDLRSICLIYRFESEKMIEGKDVGMFYKSRVVSGIIGVVEEVDISGKLVYPWVQWLGLVQPSVTVFSFWHICSERDLSCVGHRFCNPISVVRIVEEDVDRWLVY